LYASRKKEVKKTLLSIQTLLTYGLGWWGPFAINGLLRLSPLYSASGKQFGLDSTHKDRQKASRLVVLWIKKLVQSPKKPSIVNLPVIDLGCSVYDVT
jgi:hypothetical protein